MHLRGKSVHYWRQAQGATRDSKWRHRLEPGSPWTVAGALVIDLVSQG